MKRILFSLLTLTTLTASVLPASANNGQQQLQRKPTTLSAQYHREPHRICRWDRYEHREICFRHFD